jgi:MFS family permease
MVAAPFAAIISDRFGRRKGMFAGAAVIIIGAVIATTSKHIAQVDPRSGSPDLYRVGTGVLYRGFSPAHAREDDGYLQLW